jgi:hypothetical protein
MNQKYNKIYWLKNFSTNEIETFSQMQKDNLENYLIQKNKEGFNIYETVNTFI